MPLASETSSGVAHQESWPPEVSFLISVLERDSEMYKEQRAIGRTAYQVKATLELFSTDAGVALRTIPVYTRDVNPLAMGLISAQEFPIGSSARLYLPLGDQVKYISCRVLRCRLFIDGWYEGAVYFDQPHPEYAASSPA